MKKMKIFSLVLTVMSVLCGFFGFIYRRDLTNELDSIKDSYAQYVQVGGRKLSIDEYIDYADSQIELFSKIIEYSIIGAVVFAVLWIVFSILTKNKAKNVQENR